MKKALAAQRKKDDAKAKKQADTAAKTLKTVQAKSAAITKKMLSSLKKAAGANQKDVKLVKALKIDAIKTSK